MACRIDSDPVQVLYALSGQGIDLLDGFYDISEKVNPNSPVLLVNRIDIENINAFDGTPVIDIKPYIPKEDSIMDVQVAEWL